MGEWFSSSMPWSATASVFAGLLILHHLLHLLAHRLHIGGHPFGMALDSDRKTANIDGHSPEKFALLGHRRSARLTRLRNGRRELEYIKRSPRHLPMRLLLQVAAVVILQNGHRGDCDPLARIAFGWLLAIPIASLLHHLRGIGERRPIERDVGQAMFLGESFHFRQTVVPAHVA